MKKTFTYYMVVQYMVPSGFGVTFGQVTQSRKPLTTADEISSMAQLILDDKKSRIPELWNARDPIVTFYSLLSEGEEEDLTE
jgi:hypothetical protein